MGRILIRKTPDGEPKSITKRESPTEKLGRERVEREKFERMKGESDIGANQVCVSWRGLWRLVIHVLVFYSILFYIY
jgi:hypothetical protein